MNTSVYIVYQITNELTLSDTKALCKSCGKQQDGGCDACGGDLVWTAPEKTLHLNFLYVGDDFQQASLLRGIHERAHMIEVPWNEENTLGEIEHSLYFD